MLTNNESEINIYSWRSQSPSSSTGFNAVNDLIIPAKSNMIAILGISMSAFQNSGSYTAELQGLRFDGILEFNFDSGSLVNWVTGIEQFGQLPVARIAFTDCYMWTGYAVATTTPSAVDPTKSSFGTCQVWSKWFPGPGGDGYIFDISVTIQFKYL